MDMGSRIRDARIAKRLTQEELARLIGVTKGSIAHYEKNVSIPKVELLYPLMAVLGVDANYLYGVEKSDCQMMKLSLHECEVIRAYRAHSNLQAAVDRVLLLEPEQLAQPKKA